MPRYSIFNFRALILYLFTNILYQFVSSFILYQFIDLARSLASEHLHLEILPHHDAVASQNLLNGLASQLRMIVLLAEVAEPDVAQLVGGEMSKCLATGIIAEMSRRSQDAFLEILRIVALQEHLDAMVGLDDKIVGTTDEIVHLVGDVPHVGDEAEGDSLALHLIAHIVGAIVRNTKRSDRELTQGERYSLLYDSHHIRSDFLAHTVVALYSYMNFTGCIYWQMVVVTQTSHRLHVVGMVVGDKDMVNILKAHSVVVEVLLQTSQPYSYIYQ